MTDAVPERPILVVVPLPPTYRGGTEEYAYRLARRFSEHHPVRIFCSTVDPTPDSPALDTDDIPVTRMSARRVFERPLILSGQALRPLREAIQTASLVQLHMPFPSVERKVVRWAARAGVPVVLTYHMDANFGEVRGTPGAGLVTMAYRSLSARPALRGASAIVSNSLGYARDSPVLRTCLEKVRVIAKGVDRERFGVMGPLPPGRLEPGPDLLPDADPADRRVLFVGRLVPYKGVSVLIDAVARIAPSIPRLRLYIAGRGPLRPELEQQVGRLGIGPLVRFLGFVPDARLGELYRSVDVVACPSVGRLESTPTTLEEAAALGTPTVGSNLGGVDESVPHDGVHGLLCPPRDPAALALALQRLLVQPRPPPMDRWRSWEDTASDYLALFQELGAFAPTPPASHNPDIRGAG